jgi:amino acid transporter
VSLLDNLLGKPLASSEGEGQKIGPLVGIPVLGLDGLSSAAYGPETALSILLPLGVMGLSYIVPIMTVILVLLAILYFSYRQTIEAYPNGGGSYTVAHENLGVMPGLLAAASLMLDYILNVAVGISAGVAALVSAVPILHSHTLLLCLLILGIITLVNLRGPRESGVVFGIPTYLFSATLIVLLAIGIYKVIASGGHPQPVEVPPTLPAATEGVSLWLLLKAFANGCTAMTGVEAVSNGVGAFAKPAVGNAQKTLTGIVVILAILLGGIAYLAHAYHISAMDQSQANYQSVISQLLTAIIGHSLFYYVTIGSVLAVLSLSANTSFAGFPRLARLLAHDSYLPHAFQLLGRRLVYTTGILFLTFLSGMLLIIFGGITDRLIPLFAAGAFGAFTLSQAGMVIHWRRIGGKRVFFPMAVNALGAVATLIALAIILAAKFIEGAWITVLLIALLMVLFISIKKHYVRAEREVECSRPINTVHIEPPIVVVPFGEWNLVTERALRFGMRMSHDVYAVHVTLGDDDNIPLQEIWKQNVETPLASTTIPVPHLEIIASPYRRLINPLFDFITKLKKENPDKIIAVIIPELVETHWYEWFLHNHRATALKTTLLLQGDRRIVVVNVPWYLTPPSLTPTDGSPKEGHA